MKRDSSSVVLGWVKSSELKLKGAIMKWMMLERETETKFNVMMSESGLFWFEWVVVGLCSVCRFSEIWISKRATDSTVVFLSLSLARSLHRTTSFHFQCGPRSYGEWKRMKIKSLRSQWLWLWLWVVAEKVLECTRKNKVKGNNK